MSFLSSLFQSGAPTQQAPGPIQVGTSIPKELAPYYKDIMGKAQALYNERTAEGYKPYSGPTMADFTPEQKQAQVGISGLVGSQAPVFDEAMNLTRSAATPMTQDQMTTYMSPYQQAVTDIEKREATKQYESQVQPALAAQAAATGGFGGSRQAILEGMAADTQQRLLGDIQAKGSQQAYQDAVSRFNTDRQAQGQAGAQLATMVPNQFKAQLGEIGAMQTVGEQKQKQSQTALDEAFRQYQLERNFPYDAMSKYQSVVTGAPMQQTTFANPSPPTPSTAQTLLGGLGTLVGTYGAFGGKLPNVFGKEEGGVVYAEGGGGLNSLPVVYAGNGSGNRTLMERMTGQPQEGMLEKITGGFKKMVGGVTKFYDENLNLLDFPDTYSEVKDGGNDLLDLARPKRDAQGRIIPTKIDGESVLDIVQKEKNKIDGKPTEIIKKLQNKESIVEDKSLNPYNVPLDKTGRPNLSQAYLNSPRYKAMMDTTDEFTTSSNEDLMNKLRSQGLLKEGEQLPNQNVTDGTRTTPEVTPGQLQGPLTITQFNEKRMADKQKAIPFNPLQDAARNAATSQIAMDEIDKRMLTTARATEDKEIAAAEKLYLDASAKQKGKLDERAAGLTDQKNQEQWANIASFFARLGSASPRKGGIMGVLDVALQEAPKAIEDMGKTNAKIKATREDIEDKQMSLETILRKEELGMKLSAVERKIKRRDKDNVKKQTDKLFELEKAQHDLEYKIALKTSDVKEADINGVIDDLKAMTGASIGLQGQAISGKFIKSEDQIPLNDILMRARISYAAQGSSYLTNGSYAAHAAEVQALLKGKKPELKPGDPGYVEPTQI